MLSNSHLTVPVESRPARTNPRASSPNTEDRQTGLALAPLSALDLPHADYIRAAHAAGFSGVGLRIEQVTPSDPPFPRSRNSDEFRRIRRALDETGLEVVDVEVLTIRPGTGPDHWMPLFELGAELGARFVNVSAEMSSLDEFEDRVGHLTRDAHEFGIQPVLEPVAFRPLNSFERAVSISRLTGSAVVLDVLHFMRTHAELTTIGENTDLFPLLQICDAPAEVPPATQATEDHSVGDSVENMIAEARGGRLVPGDSSGCAPIREILGMLGSTTRISVEIPNTNLRAGRPAVDYLSMLFNSVSVYLNAEELT